MKKMIICAVILVMCTGAVIYAESQFRLTGEGALDLIGKPSLESLRIVLDEGVSPFYGFSWEVVINHFGFGMQYLVKFEDIDRDWVLDWHGTMVLSYHLFRPRSFIDPYAEVGIGNAGRVDLIGSNVVVEPGDVPGINLALYPHVAAGLAFKFDYLVIGGRISYRPFVERIPVAPVSAYPLKNVQVGFYAGVVFR
jgi:hypothetical protein